MLKAWFLKVQLPKSSSTVKEKELDYFVCRNNCNYVKFGFCNEWVRGRGRLGNCHLCETDFNPPAPQKMLELELKWNTWLLKEGKEKEILWLSVSLCHAGSWGPEETEGLNRERILWCRDFKCKSYCILWRSDKKDYTGQVVEMLLDGKHFVKCQWWHKMTSGSGPLVMSLNCGGLWVGNSW